MRWPWAHDWTDRRLTTGLKRFFISPPFGTYFSHPDATRVRGSYTLNPRPGLLRAALATVRPHRDGWTNRMGLRNPGIAHVSWNASDVFSLAAVDDGDWTEMFWFIPSQVTVELNLSCPNTRHITISEDEVTEYIRHCSVVVAKLPPTAEAHSLAETCLRCGVNTFHLSNTLPCPEGGRSGAILREVNLELVREFCREYPGADVVAGGGITTYDHVQAYRNLGATRFSMATAWALPWRAHRLVTQVTTEDREVA